MPSWNIHLEAGERLANKLKLSPVSRKEFLLGCLLPDINNGYINNPHITKEHEETHYAFDDKSSLNFYAENQSAIDAKNPIFLGYLFHLFVDGFFNYNFYRNIKRDEKYKDLDRVAKRKIKHHDFWLYDTKFDHSLGLKDADEAAALAHLANEIPTVDLDADDLEEIESILTSHDFKKVSEDKIYLFYSEAALDQLMDDALAEFEKQYLEKRNA